MRGRSSAMRGRVAEMLDALRARARELKRDTLAVYLAVRHPRTPWYAKAVAVCVVAYALSPIDLIPDFVPVLGYLDDLILVPIGIALAVRLIPPALLAEYRADADRRAEGPRSLAGAAIVASIWIAAAALLAWFFWPRPAS